MPSDEPKPAPHLTERGAEKRDERAKRLAEAMRANLRRRKEQTRAREEEKERETGEERSRVD